VLQPHVLCHLFSCVADSEVGVAGGEDNLGGSASEFCMGAQAGFSVPAASLSKQ